MYILARLCVWCCIHCPSGAGPGCYFYHFTLTSIIKLVYWVRQHGTFILFCLLCSSTSFPITSLSCINRLPTTTVCWGLLGSWSLTSQESQISTPQNVYECNNETEMTIIWYSQLNSVWKQSAPNVLKSAVNKTFISCSLKVLVVFLISLCVDWS